MIVGIVTSVNYDDLLRLTLPTTCNICDVVYVLTAEGDASIQAYSEQIRYHCHRCGVPLRGRGELAMTGTKEQVSETHRDIYKPKVKGREVEVVTQLDQVEPGALPIMTDYIGNGRAG